MAVSSLRPWRLLAVVVVACLLAPFAPLSLPPAAANDCNGVSFATGDAATTNEDTEVVIDILANDLCVDGVTGLTLQIVSSPSHGSITKMSVVGGFVVYTPAANYAGTDSFSYRFWSNEYPDSSTGTVTITVNPVNDAPSIFWAAIDDCHNVVLPAIAVAEDSGAYSHACELLLKHNGGADESNQTVWIVVTGFDASLFSTVPHFEGTSFVFTPAPNANGSTTFTYYAKDDGGTANGGIDTGTQYSGSITITPVDDAPVAKADSYSLKAGATRTVAAPGVLANDTDIDGPSLSVRVASLPAHGTLTLLADGSFSYQPDPGFSGTDSFTYTASDGTLSSQPAKVTLAVSATATPRPTAGATSPSPTPAASDGGAPGDGAPGSPTPSSPAPSATAPDASITPDASGSEPTTSPDAAPTQDPSGSVASVQGSEPPWVAIIAIVLILVVGSNLVVYQVLRRR